MRVWLDDVRQMPFGYDAWAKTADEAITALRDHDVDHISLDHDLADEHYPDGLDSGVDYDSYREKTGYSVVLWMVENNKFPKSIHVHSLNTVGVASMLSTLLRYAPEGTEILRVMPPSMGSRL
jgi:hypothetical protein